MENWRNVVKNRVATGGDMLFWIVLEMCSWPCLTNTRTALPSPLLLLHPFHLPASVTVCPPSLPFNCFLFTPSFSITFLFLLIFSFVSPSCVTHPISTLFSILLFLMFSDFSFYYFNFFSLLSRRFSSLFQILLLILLFHPLFCLLFFFLLFFLFVRFSSRDVGLKLLAVTSEERVMKSALLHTVNVWEAHILAIPVVCNTI